MTPARSQLRDSPEVEAARVRRFLVPDSPMRVTPEAAGPDHVAFFDALAEARVWEAGREWSVAQWAAGAAEPDAIEIFLSAGPIEAINSCDSGNQANCLVYRVRWSLSREVVVGTPDVVSPTWTGSPNPNWTCGFVEPEVEAGTGQLAMLRRCFHNASGGEHSGELHVGFPRAGGRFLFTNFDYGEAQETRPQWPAWSSQRQLVFSRGPPAAQPDLNTLYTVHSTGGSEGARAGLQSAHNQDYSYGNPRPYPRGACNIRQAGRIASFGIDPASPEPVPHTHDLNGDNIEMFDLPITDTAGIAFTSCHHPDWNAEGTRILCTRHEAKEAASDGRKLRQLHEFTFDASTAHWESAGALFGPIALADLPATVYPSGACDILTYKYARYVGSNHVLVTVFCSTKLGDVLGSRVLLVENPTAAHPVYHDLTQVVQDTFGPQDAPWRSVFASWWAVS